jgi:hypothetical protein
MIPDGRNRRWDDFDVLKYVNGHKQNFKQRLNNETLARRSHNSTRLLLLLEQRFVYNYILPGVPKKTGYCLISCNVKVIKAVK